MVCSTTDGLFQVSLALSTLWASDLKPELPKCPFTQFAWVRKPRLLLLLMHTHQGPLHANPTTRRDFKEALPSREVLEGPGDNPMGGGFNAKRNGLPPKRDTRGRAGGYMACLSAPSCRLFQHAGVRRVYLGMAHMTLQPAPSAVKPSPAQLCTPSDLFSFGFSLTLP